MKQCHFTPITLLCVGLWGTLMLSWVICVNEINAYHFPLLTVFVYFFPLAEWSIERQVLHSQCKRLEAQNYNLTRTAEQLSLTMGVSICLFASLFHVDLCVFMSVLSTCTFSWKG